MVMTNSTRGKIVDKILVVEDDATLLEMLKYNLTRQEYEVLTAEDGRTGLQLARDDRPDLIILDVMLPIMDGFEVCRILRKEMSVPVLMLTARTEEIDKIVGLEMGADDYITKPFSMRELLARVRAHLRRVEMIREDVTAERNGNSSPQIKGVSTLNFGNLTIDENSHEVRIDGSPIR
jgi:DNA-binding response OmpR family regulator